MDSLLLAVPLRTGAPVRLEVALEAYIQQNYDQNPAPYIDDCRALADLRTAALSYEPQQLLTYFSALRTVANKFPGDLCTLEWRSSLGYASNPVHNKHLWFDAVNVLYNVAAQYTQAASTSGDYKVAYQQLQLAAGAFELCRDHAKDLGVEVNGLDEGTLQYLKLLSLAQAQECFWVKLREHNKGGNSLSAKLAAGAAETYEKVERQAARVPQLKSEWIDHVAAKLMLFKAIAQYRQGLDCLERREYGQQVAWLLAAQKTLAAPTGQYAPPQLQSRLADLKLRVESDVHSAQKENDLLYLHAVPSLPGSVKPQCVAKLTTPTVPQGPKLFTMLLPFAVYQAPAAYAQRLDNYVSDFIIQELESLNQQVVDVFAEFGLPASLELVNEPDVMPRAIVQESEYIQSHGGMESVQSFLDENIKLSENARHRLSNLDAKIDETVQLQDYLLKAAASDQLVQERINSSKYLVDILSQGYAAIETFVPQGHIARTGQSIQQESTNVLTLVHQLEACVVRRKDKVAALRARLKTVDLSTPFHKFIETSPTPIKEPSQLEPVYNGVVSQFDEDVLSVDRSKLKQAAAIDTLREKMGVFNAKKYEFNSTTSGRQQAIDALQAASHQYKTITTNLKEGRDFYNALLSKIAKLEEAPVPGAWTPDMPINFG